MWTAPGGGIRPAGPVRASVARYRRHAHRGVRTYGLGPASGGRHLADAAEERRGTVCRCGGAAPGGCRRRRLDVGAGTAPGWRR